MLTKIEKRSYIETIQEVLIEEANAIINLQENLSADIDKTIDMILNCTGRIIVTGVGKSGIIGRKITATFASTGTPSLFLHPSEGLHGDLGMVTSSDIVLALSNSGESEEVLNIIPSIKRIGAKLIGVVGNESSTLAKKSDSIVCIGKVTEACPLGLAPTTSTTLTLALGDAIAVALLKARNFLPENFAVFHPGGSLGRKLLLTINDIIDSKRVNPTCIENSNVKDAIFKMTESGLGAITIVDDNGKIKGILTDGDIRRALKQESDLLNQPIKKLSNNYPTTIKSDVLAAEALNIMEVKKIAVLPVVNVEEEPIAMIHLHDLTRLGL